MQIIRVPADNNNPDLLNPEHPLEVLQGGKGGAGYHLKVPTCGHGRQGDQDPCRPVVPDQGQVDRKLFGFRKKG